MDDDEYSSDDMEDIDELEEKSLADLRSGKVQVRNSDGTLRCPYSPGRKKQAYPHKDLLQHAEGVSKGKRGAEAAGKHRALCKYLKTDLVDMVVPPVERVNKLDLVAPQRKVAEDLFVYPWCGVIYNIQNTKRSSTGLRVGPGVSDIRQYFSAFNPEKTHVFWGPQGHMGMAVLTFTMNLKGLSDAQALDKWFIDKGLGRRDWERRRRENKGLGIELYGWLARKEDYVGRGATKEDGIIARYLQETGDLKDVHTVGEERDKIHDQRFKSLSESVSQKNSEFQKLLTESEIIRRNAEVAMLQLEETHKKELKEVMNKAKQSTEEHTKSMHEHNQILQSSMEALQKRCKELEDKEKNMQNPADRTVLLQEKNQNRWQLDVVSQQSKIQKKHQADQLKLIKKHEAQKKELELNIQEMKLRLAKQQESELENQRHWEIAETEKFKELAESFNGSDEESKNDTETLETKMKEWEEKKKEYEEELEDLKDENENKHKMINDLTSRHMTVNDELQDAKKKAVIALAKHGNEILGVKRMGDIDPKPWESAFRKRYKNHKDGWEMVFSTKLSEWEDLLKDNDFNIFKMVQKKEGEDKWERQVVDDNEQLNGLRSELGDEVCQTVVTAMTELEEYNASGRYPVPVAWNFAKGKDATLEEVITHLLNVIKADPKKKKAVRRNAANR